MKYHIWTDGCQMNVANSQRVASELEKLGYRASRRAEEADVIVLNTCVVRQSAEDRAYGRMSTLQPLKQHRPDMVINVMGCMVGVAGARPSKLLSVCGCLFAALRSGAAGQDLQTQQGKQLEVLETQRRHDLMDGQLVLPLAERGRLVAAHVPIVYGCSHACTFCIIPFRRGIERSRPVGEIAAEVRALVAQGVNEVTLLGQIVDRYGADVPDGPNLAALLRVVHEMDGLERIRFLTSHPN